MEVNEVATRIVRRYWPLILVAVTLPVLAVAGWVLRQPGMYTAHARLVATATVPRAQAEATAVVDQVDALATSRDVIAKALTTNRLDRDPDAVAKAVTVTGLGSSAIVDLGYSDADPAMAQQVTAALATEVATQLDDVQVGGLPDVLAAVDAQLTALATKRAPIASQAQANPKDPVLQNRLAGIDRLIPDLSGDRDRLAEESAAAGHASVVTAPTRPAHADPRGLGAKTGIAAILGFILGLIAVGMNEMARPSVAGTSRVARLLSVPTLGVLAADPGTLADAGRRIRLAAMRAKVSSVVLVRAAGGWISPETVDRIEAATLRPAVARPRVAVKLSDEEYAEPADATAELRRPPEGYLESGQFGTLAVLAKADGHVAKARVARVCALDELDPSVEGDRIGLVVLAGGITRLTAIDRVRDLLNASGWPLLGVLGDNAPKAAKR